MNAYDRSLTSSVSSMFSSGEMRKNPFSRMGSDYHTRKRPLPGPMNLSVGRAMNAEQYQLSEISDSSISPLSIDCGSAGSEKTTNNAQFHTALPYPAKDLPLLETKVAKDDFIVGDLEESPLFPIWESVDKVNFSKNMLFSDSSTDKKGSGSTLSQSALSPLQQQQKSPFKAAVLQLEPSPISPNEEQQEVEKHGERQKKITKQRRKANIKSFVSGFLLLVLTLLSIVALSTSQFTCKSSDQLCLPQFTVQLDDSTPQAADALSSAREILKLLSYVAVDLGTDFNAEDETDNSYLNTVDTFGLGNLFGINHQGYCRDNLNTGRRFCTACDALSIVSTFVRDAGIQLAQITGKRGNKAKEMGESFVLTYKTLLDNLEDDQVPEIMIQNNVIKSLKRLDQLLPLNSYIIWMILVTCSIETVTCLLLLTSFIFKRPRLFYRHRYRYAKLLCSLTSIAFLLDSVACVMLIIYVGRLSKLALRSEVAIISWGLGLYLMVGGLLMTLASSLCAFAMMMSLSHHEKVLAK